MTEAPSTRIAPLSIEEASPEIREAFEVNQAYYGEVLNAVAVTARHPEVFRAYWDFEAGLLKARRTEKSLRSLIMLKVATHLGCAFCIDIGSFLGTEREGVTERQILELPDFRTSDAFSPRERLALEYALAMSGTRAEVDDALFEALHAEFTEEQIVEITAIAAWENYRGRFNRAVGLQAHGFTANSVCALPEVE
ncbi:MAG: carboxymuconolactone decarboxylase family protein [Dehalococcoidia bacterium]|nr:carboxymuconolactone decarboxylase family protein [Dehalococcoidia bacterium]